MPEKSGRALAICERLPLLYRPDEEDASLYARFIRAAAAVLDEAQREAGMVMLSHWFPAADEPRFSHWLALRYERAGKSSPARS